MTEAANDKGEEQAAEDRIAALSFGLLDAYGVDSCEVVEAQIKAATDDENRVTWTAIWEHLCSPEARRA